ncbi:PHP domain-containing protein [Brevibacillus sp. CF112]|uniref:TrlF family AAA-like ATPase n=1 Tax=Brevibacillus TaxID=55080 RepID=UPI0002718FFA|nr:MULTISPECIES: AAA family ATPase [Brevibacillus]EJL48017.1 PHP domain-containing protein [Brevibacillus sp. CF112]
MDKGAHYYRCDFQVHSPRDLNWNGRTYITEQERVEYAKRFIKTCREKGLHAIAITDHHDTVFYKYIRDASLSEVTEDGGAIDESDRIVIFPGIEVSIAQPSAQLLILFDPDIDITYYSQVPIKLGITTSAETEAKTCQTIQLNLSIADIQNRLSESPELANRFIILPNVKPGGYKTFLRHGNHTVFSNLPCVGGYVEGVYFDDLGEGERRILEGKVPAWSTRAYGVFQTSDCRQDDLNTLGTFSTWVKWSKPSVEALRQACLSISNRISHRQPIIPSVFIQRVKISDSKFLGPVDLGVNPQFNALIGGRGTGKSSFLEYLRWGLCDPTIENSTDGGIRAFEKKRSDLISSTLESIGASVTVDWIANGVKHSVKRDSKTNTIELKIGSHSPRPATMQDVRSLIGIQSYSQKELSTVGVDIKELRRFIETPIRPQLNALSDQIESLSTEIRQDVIRLRDKKRVSMNVSRERMALASLKEQASTIREQLKGLPEESKLTVDQHPLIEQEALFINRFNEKLEKIIKDVNTLKESVESLNETIKIDNLPNGILIGALQDSISHSVSQFNDSLDSLTNGLLGNEDHIPEWRNSIVQWEHIYSIHNEKFQEAIEQNIQYQNELKNLNDKEEQIREKESLLSKYLDELIELMNPEEDIARRIDELIKLYYGQRQLLSDQCSYLTSLSNGQIQASLANAGDIEEHHSMVTKTIQGANISTEKIRRLLERIETSSTPFEEWQRIVSEIQLIWDSFEENGADFTIPDVPSLRNSGLIDNEIRRLAARIDSEKLITLLLYRFKEKPIFKYCVSGGDAIDFEQASAGQQASALLKVLLSSEGPPLIIDQPEDDLDNEIVAEIANDIWEAKKKRQIIFASHNANLVVNGDAELVVHFGYRNEGDQSIGHVNTVGSIDVPEIKEAIKKVMEGGERAFKLRQEKYGF